MEEQGAVPAEQFHQVMALYHFVGPFAEVIIRLFILQFDVFDLGRQNADQSIFFRSSRVKAVPLFKNGSFSKS